MTRTTLCVPYPITPGPGLKAAGPCLSYVSQIMVKEGQIFISAPAPGTTGAPTQVPAELPRHARPVDRACQPGPADRAAAGAASLLFLGTGH